MVQLIVDLTSVESMALSVEIISERMGQMGGTVAQVPIKQVAEVTEIEEPVEDLEPVEELEPELVDDSDGLEDLMEDEPEPTGPGVEDIKLAFKDLATAAGKEKARTIIQNIFGRLGVKKMDEIPTDKIATVIAVLNKAAKA